MTTEFQRPDGSTPFLVVPLPAPVDLVVDAHHVAERWVSARCGEPLLMGRDVVQAGEFLLFYLPDGE